MKGAWLTGALCCLLWTSAVRGAEEGGPAFDGRAFAEEVALGLTVWQWWHAWERNDSAAIERLSAQLRFLGPNSRPADGSDQGCPLCALGGLLGGAVAESWDVTGLAVYREGTTVVVFYDWVVQQKARAGNQPISRRGTAMDVLVRQAGKWRYVAQHLDSLNW